MVKEVIKISQQAVCIPKFEVKLVGSLSAVRSTVYLIAETVSNQDIMVKRVNAKSLIGVLSLELKAGDSITVQAVGDDEAKAIQLVKSILC